MTPTTRAITALAAFVAALAGPVAPGPPATAHPATPYVETVPRAHRVVMFSDSVGLGARVALPQAFPADWEVNVDGQPARFVEQLETDFVRPRLASDPGWFGDHVVIAAGYNYPYWDPDRFDRSIDSMVNTLVAAGVEHVHWVTLREVDPQFVSPAAWRQIQPYFWYFPTVNDHLEAALDRHPELRLVDWAAAADRTGLTYDAIHLNPTGAALYSDLVRRSVDAAATTVPDRSTTRVRVPGAAGAAVAAFNVTTTDPRHHGHLRVWDCAGPPPTVAVHTYDRAETVAHAGIAPLAANGEFCIYARTSTNLVVDITGTFGATDDLVRIEPVRWIDTRPTRPIEPGGTIELDVADVARVTDELPGAGPPWAAVAVVVTAVDPADRGWLRIVGCDAAPTAETANVNYRAGSSTPNLAIVAPAEDGTICVTSRARADVVVDLFGVFRGGADVSAGAAVRWFDSRDAGRRVPAGATTVLDVADAGIEAGAGGVVINISAVDPSAPGYVTAYPCGTERPLAANLNASGTGVVSNAAIVRPGAGGRVCLYTRAEMDLVVDATGSIGAAFTGRVPARALDTRG